MTSEIIIDPATNERFIIMMYPIVSDDQFLGGVLALNRLENLVDFTSVLDTDKGYQTAIVDAQSMLLDSHVEAMYELDQVIGNAKTEDMFYAWNDQRLVAVTMTKNEFLNWYIVTELDMSTYYLNFWILLLIIGATSLSTVAIIQISKRRNKVLEPLLQRLHTDDLTGISNRSYFENRVKSYLKQDHHQFDHAAFILLDLDNFKEINDRLSHLVGDQVIQETALKIHTQMRNTDVVARFGGDEFAIFMNGVRDEKAIIEKVQTLLKVLAANYADETTSVAISVSIGITMITSDSTTYEQLYAQADEALYKAKRHGRNCAAMTKSDVIIEANK